MVDQSEPDLQRLDIPAELRKRERVTKRRVLAITVASTFIILLGVSLFALFSYRQSRALWIAQYINSGSMLRDQGKYVDAIAAFRAAIALDPSNSQA
jgi:hypothetical protein